MGFARDDAPFPGEVKRVIRVTRLSLGAERSYLRTIIVQLLPQQAHPEALGGAGAQAYLGHLALEKRTATSLFGTARGTKTA